MKYERIDETTPNGGDYSEIYYCDADNNLVDAKYATQFHLRECKNDGTLINEIHGLCNR